MTMPHERTHSLIQTGEFLLELTKNTELPELIRRQAEGLLRHYPSAKDFTLQAQVESRCREELTLLADQHGSLHPVLVLWLNGMSPLQLDEV